MPLFNVKLDRTNDTESGQNVQSKFNRKKTSHAIKELKENTLNKRSLEPVLGNTQGRRQTRGTCSDATMRSNTIPYVGSGR